MFLAHSLKLLGLVLSLSIFASATPVDIDIVTGSPAALVRRLPKSQKDQCPYPFHWVRRECRPNAGPEFWRDVCEYNRRQPFPTTMYHFLYNQCPKNWLCVPDVDGDGDESIKCVKPEERSDPSSSRPAKKQKTSGAQYGTSEVQVAHSGNDNAQLEFDAKIGWDIPGASVSAEFLSMDNSFAVAFNTPIVGKIKGTDKTVCKGDKSDPRKARQCVPTGEHDLKAKEDINFTYGLTPGQKGRLAWAAVPDGRIVHDKLR